MLDRSHPDAVGAAAGGVRPVAWRWGRRALRGLGVAWRLTSRRLASSLTRRIVVLNLVGLFTMLIGFLWLNQTREGLIDARVQSLLIQGEIIASAVAGSATVDNDAIMLDPDKLLQLQAGETANGPDESLPSLEFSLNPERVAPVLRRLVAPARTRARIYDRDGTLLVDTRAGPFSTDVLRFDLPPIDGADGTTLIERSWSTLKRRFGKVDVPLYEDLAARPYPEVGRALAGATTTLVRINAQGQTIVFVSVPVQRYRAVRGALLLSTQEGDIDAVITRERVSIVLIFLIASAVMLALSLLLANTIAGPMRRLAEAAERVQRGGRLRQQIPDYSRRADEIGHLSSALRDMTRALYSRIEAIESFAADVSHELKNPLTSLRSAVETLPLARNENSRNRLLAVIEHDVRRLDRLISDISDASRLDAELARADAEPVDLAELLRAAVSVANEIRREDGVTVTLAFDPPGGAAAGAFTVLGHDSRLGRVLHNLVDNARSFSAAGGAVRLTARRVRDMVEILVDDDGPGIPEHALVRIFERFYTDRPEEQGFGQNSGLGLSISRQIVEAHHGSVTAQNRLAPDGSVEGARFIVRLPAKGR